MTLDRGYLITTILHHDYKILLLEFFSYLWYLGRYQVCIKYQVSLSYYNY